MDRRERFGSLEEAFLLAGERIKSEVWCALPGQVVSFDPAAMTVVVQVTIQMVFRGPAGVESLVSVPPLLDCPVVFPAAGGFSLTFPVKPGDECLVVFGDRCIDAWHQNSGVQPQAEFRVHDLSDGFAIVGVRSKPRALVDYHPDNVQLRNDAGDTFVEITPDKDVRVETPANVVAIADEIQCTAATKMHIVAPLVEIEGNVTVTGSITAGGDVVGAGVSLETHQHGGVDTGGGVSGPPV